MLDQQRTARIFRRRSPGFLEQQTLPLHRFWLAGSEPVRSVRGIRCSCYPPPAATTRSDRRAPSSTRAISQIPEPPPAFAPTHLLCPSTPEISGRCAGARRSPPAICLCRYKDERGPTCQNRVLQSESGLWKTYSYKMHLE